MKLKTTEWGVLMTYKDIRENYQSKNYLFIVDRYACIISPVITKRLVKTKLTPNMITVLMMISGVIGAALFAMPQLFLKIIGIIFIHLWYILDCCDGEVARIKRQFSKFGKEIDYTAHILNHPLFTLAFMTSIMQLKIFNNTIIATIFMIIIVVNLMFRNILIFNSIYQDKIQDKIQDNDTLPNKGNKLAKRIFIIKIMDNISTYPNFALIFPIVYIFDIIVNTKCSILYAVIFALSSSIIVYLKLFLWIKKIVKL